MDKFLKSVMYFPVLAYKKLWSEPDPAIVLLFIIGVILISGALGWM